MRAFFTKNPLMKLLALSLSMALWWFVRSERQNEKTVDVPVSYTSPPKELIFASDLQKTIRLRLRGPQSKLTKVDEDYFSSHVVNLSNAVPGQNSFWLYEDDFRLPFGVYVTQIYPQAIRVALKPRRIGTIEIKPRFRGELPPGMEISNVKVTPSSVSFESYQDELDKIKFFQTEPIMLTNRTQSFDGEYRIDTKAHQGVLVTNNVKVEVALVEKEISETIPAVPLELGPAYEDIVIEPDSVSIKVSGPLSRVLTVVKQPPKPFFNASELSSLVRKQKDAQIKVQMPNVEGVTLTVSPESVWVRF